MIATTMWLSSLPYVVSFKVTKALLNIFWVTPLKRVILMYWPELADLREHLGEAGDNIKQKTK